MPIFEYKCADCGKITEVLVKSNRTKKAACEHCGSKNTEKQFSTFTAQVKSAPASNPGCMTCPNGTCPHAGGL